MKQGATEKQCQAQIEVPGKSYSMQRIRTTSTRQCSRKATYLVAHLALCATHGRMALQGFIGENGVVMATADIAETKRNGRSGWHTWALNAKKVEVEP
jgi:hypothetical protein